MEKRKRGRPRLSKEEKEARRLAKIKESTREEVKKEPGNATQTDITDLVKAAMAKYNEEWRKQVGSVTEEVEWPDKSTQQIIQINPATEYKIEDIAGQGVPDFIAKDREGWVPVP